MEAVRAIASGGDAPTDARAGLLASELVHAARTGRHPRRGGVARQRASYGRLWPVARFTVQMIDARARSAGATNGRPA